MQYSERKTKLVNKIAQYLGEYKQIIIVRTQNVSTNQIHKARELLKGGKGEMIIGKNKLVLKALSFRTTDPDPSSNNHQQHSKFKKILELESLKALVKDKIGFIFTSQDFYSLKTQLEQNVISQPARVGAVSPCDVTLPAGPTNLDPGQIDLFHKCSIPVKTAKQTIEITKDFPIIKKNTKVSASAALLCSKLKLTPFNYSLEFVAVYDSGAVMPQHVLNSPPEQTVYTLQDNIRKFVAISLAANLPNQASAPHMITNSFKQLLAIGIAGNYSFKQLKEAQSGAGKAAAPAQAAPKKEEPKKEEPKKVEKVEEPAEVDMGGLFD